MSSATSSFSSGSGVLVAEGADGVGCGPCWISECSLELEGEDNGEEEGGIIERMIPGCWMPADGLPIRWAFDSTTRVPTEGGAMPGGGPIICCAVGADLMGMPAAPLMLPPGGPPPGAIIGWPFCASMGTGCEAAFIFRCAWWLACMTACWPIGYWWPGCVGGAFTIWPGDDGLTGTYELGGGCICGGWPIIMEPGPAGPIGCGGGPLCGGTF